MVVVAGETVTLLPFKLPGIHVYEVAPVAESVVVPLAQMVDGEAAVVIDGAVLTVMVNVEVDEHPPEVPVTV